MRLPKRWCLGGIGALALTVMAFPIASGQIVVLRVKTASMQPTYCVGDLILVHRRYPGGGLAALRDHVIVFSQVGHGLIAKRVVGSPGDVLHYSPHRFGRNGKLIANLDKCPAKWTADDTPVNNRDYLVPDHFVFLLGDNYGESEDSRVYGSVAESSVVGTVVSNLSSGISSCTCGDQSGESK